MRQVMKKRLDFSGFKHAMSLEEEVFAYEKLWASGRSSYVTIHKRFKDNRLLPSALLREHVELFPAEQDARIKEYLEQKAPLTAMVRTRPQFSAGFDKMRYPLALFYYEGDIDLSLSEDIVSVVGTRNNTERGRAHTVAIVKSLVDRGCTVVSGLARGIDTIALETAIECGGRVIGVIGTPLDQHYPKENRRLQEKIKNEHLLISHVPFYRYAQEPFSAKKYYFPQRNSVMAAVSRATIIVEASETSGTRVQADECVYMGKPLFILKGCFEKGLAWVKRHYQNRNAIMIDNLKCIYERLGV